MSKDMLPWGAVVALALALVGTYIADVKDQASVAADVAAIKANQQTMHAEIVDLMKSHHGQ